MVLTNDDRIATTNCITGIKLADTCSIEDTVLFRLVWLREKSCHEHAPIVTTCFVILTVVLLGCQFSQK